MRYGILLILKNKLLEILVRRFFYKYLIKKVDFQLVIFVLYQICKSNPDGDENEIIIRNLYEKHKVDREIPFYDRMKTIDIVLTEYLKNK